MKPRYDVVIVGGGAIGSAIAAFLAMAPDFDGSVLVVEKDPSYAKCSTTLSAGSIRQQFSTPVNIAISRFGIDFLKHVDAHLAVDGEAPDIGFVEGGYLFLATARGLATLEANHRVQRAECADVVLLDPAALAARFPWLATEGLAAGSLGLRDEGWFDPYALLQAYRRKARSRGVAYVADTVVDLDLAGRRVAEVVLASGQRVACGTLVDAAGIRAADIATMAGLVLPVRPRKRIVYVFDCRSPVPGLPLLIHPNGVWVRPESGQFICGVSPPAEDDPDCDDFEIDYRWFEELIWPTLAARIPAFEAIKQTRAWAGHYAHNLFDQNAVLGRHPEIANFLFANGFSGHGLQQSPAVGRGLAELIVHGAYRSLDLSALDYARIPENRPVREQAVV